MYGVYYHFNNLRFRESQHVIEFSAAHVVTYCASSEIMKCRLLKRFLNHPMS